MNINKLKAGTKCRLLQNRMDLKSGQLVTISTDSAFHRGDSVLDLQGDLWVSPLGDGEYNHLCYCLCDSDEAHEYLKVLKY